ncbi:glycerol acyltransferase [Amylibacter marinus]|uniref:Glycerol acyltransferase n=1 Tax=Amylibacter marinus TaxID=1475483 RepID=A0ABQ5VV05_9RHOB|nr:lysophospholipid acyltransferase family protein [Amylibacter marinus]GLQ35031.1 glycerol acyltransferase [Amylibacter marinus]
MVEQNQNPKDFDPNKLYDRSDLTYANSFPQFYKRWFISIVEALTARYYLLYKMRKWERNPNKDPDFWVSVLEEMNIKLTTSKEDIARIPAEGPLVIVSNHPHGLIDGIVMAHLISHVRDDYQILTRALLVGVTRVEKYLLPVSFPHEEDSVRKNIKMRQAAVQALKDQHCIALFPAGTVSTSPTFFGEPEEREWATFTSKMIRQSGARVLPIYFTGSNTRLFHIANKLGDTLRQSLLLYEIRAAFNKNQSPVIGELIDPEALKPFEKDSKGMMAFLREETLKLKPSKK